MAIGFLRNSGTDPLEKQLDTSPGLLCRFNGFFIFDILVAKLKKRGHLNIREDLHLSNMARIPL